MRECERGRERGEVSSHNHSAHKGRGVVRYITLSPISNSSQKSVPLLEAHPISAQLIPYKSRSKIVLQQSVLFLYLKQLRFIVLFRLLRKKRFVPHQLLTTTPMLPDKHHSAYLQKICPSHYLIIVSIPLICFNYTLHVAPREGPALTK